MNKVQELYVNWVKSKWFLSALVLIYFFYILVPAYYSINYRLPAENELKRSDGTFFRKYIPPRRGDLVRLNTAEGETFFTCMSPFRRSSIPLRKELLKDLEGKEVTILWYRRHIYFGSYTNYIVQLKVGDRITLTQEKTRKSLHTEAVSTAVMSLAVLFIFYYVYRRALKRAARIENCAQNN